MTFHMIGCTGSPGTATATVAAAIAAQPVSAFLYHLGDITYTDKTDPNGLDQVRLYNEQFLGPSANYRKSIVAIAGNHDGKLSSNYQQSAIHNFLENFCADPAHWPSPWTHDSSGTRPAMIQPYYYWRFETPLASFLGLYANSSNGGILDDP